MKNNKIRDSIKEVLDNTISEHNMNEKQIEFLSLLVSIIAGSTPDERIIFFANMVPVCLKSHKVVEDKIKIIKENIKKNSKKDPIAN